MCSCLGICILINCNVNLTQLFVVHGPRLTQLAIKFAVYLHIPHFRNFSSHSHCIIFVDIIENTRDLDRKSVV